VHRLRTSTYSSQPSCYVIRESMIQYGRAVKVAFRQFCDLVFVFWADKFCGPTLAHSVFCTYSISKPWSYKIMAESSAS
jgi:hypothetical protein